MKNNDANDSIVFKHNLRIKTMVMICLTVISTALFVIFALLSVKRPEFTLCFYIFLLFVFIFFFLTYICDKKENKYKLPPIDNTETLNDYLKFFINNKISNFKYALPLSWISKLIVEAKNSPEIEQNQDEPDAGSTCLQFISNGMITKKNMICTLNSEIKGMKNY